MRIFKLERPPYKAAVAAYSNLTAVVPAIIITSSYYHISLSATPQLAVAVLDHSLVTGRFNRCQYKELNRKYGT